MAAKTSKPELTVEDLKVGRVYRSKKPKAILFIGIDDRAIIHISKDKCYISSKKPIYTEEYKEWFEKNKKAFDTLGNELTQIEFVRATDKSCTVIEMDYIVQYDSPSVKHGSRYPSMPAKKFLKWASHDVTDILPKDEWATSLES